MPGIAASSAAPATAGMRADPEIASVRAQRQHDDAAADQPVGAERERPVAEAAGKPDRIVGAERPDEGEQPDETDQRRALAGERPGAEQFTMRERQFLQPTN